ncbi:MAG: alpha/beta hydrolase family protein, partial [Pyrinomonadaceae bacterium]
MKILIRATTFLTLILMPMPAVSQGNEGAVSNGRIIEKTAFALPSFEQIPDRFNRLYPREAVERMRGNAELELLKIKYMSDGLKVSGFIYGPKDTAGKRLPAVIYNRGGVGEDTIISTQNFINLYEMHRYASEGFVVLASQYRGYDGGEGKDEVGGADTNDVLNLIQLARRLGYVDMDRIFMFGVSRGAIMTLQAIRLGAPIRAAVVVGAPTDMVLSRQENPGIRDLSRTHWPGPDSRLEEHLETRSPVRWADRLTVPVLIFHGGADPAVSTRHSLELAQRMDAAANLYELIVYAKDDHFVTQNSE